MEKLHEYRRHAAECRELAARARTPDEKRMLMEVAESWETLATNRERQLRRQSNIDRPSEDKRPEAS
jgi:hypothetical protein